MELPHGKIVSNRSYTIEVALLLLGSLLCAIPAWVLASVASVEYLYVTPNWLYPPGQDGQVDYNTLGKMVTAHILGEVGSWSLTKAFKSA